MPDNLYNFAKLLSSQQEWTLAETIRRALEDFREKYPLGRVAESEWKLPGPYKMGKQKIRLEDYNFEAEAILEKLKS